MNNDTRGPLKLNLGCGDKHLPGYANIDIRPECKPGLACDTRKLPYEDNTVDELVAFDLIEHFPRKETESVLREWCRVMKPGAELRLQLPDLEKHAELVLIHKADAENSLGIARLIYGEQDHDFNFHLAGFTFVSLRVLLEKAGFKNVRKEDVLGVAGYNMTLFAKKE